MTAAPPAIDLTADEWVDNHRDYLLSEIDGVAPIPVYGVRMALCVGAAGRLAISWRVDNPVALNRFELAGALDELRRKVLNDQEKLIVELRPDDT